MLADASFVVRTTGAVHRIKATPLAGIRAGHELEVPFVFDDVDAPLAASVRVTVRRMPVRKGAPMGDLSVLMPTVTELNRVVDNIKPGQLGDSTPCTEWVVRDVLNHLAAGGTMFAIGAEQGTVSDELVRRLFVTEDQLGDDYKAAVRSSSERALAAFSTPGVFETTLSLPMWEVRGHVAATVAVFDFDTHICDLAPSTSNSNFPAAVDGRAGG
jgi:uncharacterized protein (TIGR03086 family)